MVPPRGDAGISTMGTKPSRTMGEHGQATAYLPCFFLADEGLNPAFNPRQILIQAGDIEENPGPNPGPKCDSCGGTIRRDTVPFQCSTTGCNRICHKQLKCSRVSRWTTINQEWICNSHRTSSATDTDTDSITNTSTISNHSQHYIRADKQKDPPARNQCGACGKGFSTRMTPIMCKQPLCQGRSHRQQKCSGIGRYQRVDEWECPEHRIAGGQEPRTVAENGRSQTPQELQPKANCSKCRKTSGRAQDCSARNVVVSPTNRPNVWDCPGSW